MFRSGRGEGPPTDGDFVRAANSPRPVEAPEVGYVGGGRVDVHAIEASTRATEEHTAALTGGGGRDEAKRTNDLVGQQYASTSGEFQVT
jgi:hypothetical protein